ncbi:hypothetical protein Bbelb_303880 [Branchiostoma belcheri]|nr:hypothetical protein Bbelb_303880 [Branchiostoma belcheri]
MTCRKDGGTLFMPKDAETNAILISMASKLSHWIGLHDQREEGHFEWLDGSALGAFNSWDRDSNEPDNKRNQDCVHWKVAKWYDRACNESRRFICQVVPTRRWPFQAAPAIIEHARYDVMPVHAPAWRYPSQQLKRIKEDSAVEESHRIGSSMRHRQPSQQPSQCLSGEGSEDVSNEENYIPVHVSLLLRIPIVSGGMCSRGKITQLLRYNNHTVNKVYTNLMSSGDKYMARKRVPDDENSTRRPRRSYRSNIECVFRAPGGRRQLK